MERRRGDEVENKMRSSLVYVYEHPNAKVEEPLSCWTIKLSNLVKSRLYNVITVS